MANFIVENALYVVATPIGNLDDITFRAVETLKNVDVIACEDTRNTSILLDKYKISTNLVSYHKFNEKEKTEYFLNLLKEGKSIGLVSDAGTPLISDPGNVLVQEVINKGYKVIPICGACALITLLSSVSRLDEDFKFVGFFPKAKNKIIEIIKENRAENLIFYESPNRLIETLKIIYENFGDLKISLGRELTKKFEEILTLNVSKIIKHFETNPLKGELVVLIHKKVIQNEINIEEKIKTLKSLKLKNSLSDKDISMILSSLFDTNKNEVYKKCVELTKN